MELVDVASSLFCGRVRAILYHKGLTAQVTRPPGGLGSAEHRLLDPVARVPALRMSPSEPWLHESFAIALRLEEIAPAPALEPPAPALKGTGRQAMLFIDNYVTPALFDLQRLSARDGVSPEIERSRGRLAAAYDWLDGSLPGSKFVLGEQLTLADIWLALSVALARDFERRLDLPLAPPARLSVLADRALTEPALARVMVELLAERRAA